MSGADGFPRVQGRCPACRLSSLFLAEGGHVTCASLSCPNPEAADLLLREEPHTIPARVLLPPMSEAELEDAVRNAGPGALQILPSPPVLSPVQLRALAERIRFRHRPPTVSLSPGEYVSAEALHALADALDGLAEEEIAARVQEAEADL